jgi:glycosyltransferase involved in cell wall biosynthesis
MRFCMVTTFYPPYHFGGDALFVHALARSLVARGHEVEVVHCEDAYRLHGKPPPAQAIDDGGVVVHRLRSRLGWFSPLVTHQTGRPGPKTAALRAILDRSFDVVNFHNISLVGGPGVLRMSKASVSLFTLHEHWLLCPTHAFWKNRRYACEKPQCFQCCLRSGIPPQLWRYTSLIERCLASVDALIAPSEYTAERHRAAGVAIPIHVLPSFSSFEPVSSSREPPNPAQFLFVGRITASKGIAALLREFSPSRDHTLIVVGDGDLRQSLQREYADHPRIRFLGQLSPAELVPLYQQATAVVVPSLAPEVFPLCVIEAFACGTPAIVHGVGGSREAVEKTGGGIVYTDRTGLQRALSALADNPDLRRILSRKARAGYEEHYSEARYLARYLDRVETIRRGKSAVSLQAAPTSSART